MKWIISNLTDFSSIVIAIIALLYSIISNNADTRRKVQPYIQFQMGKTKIELDNEATYKLGDKEYRIFIDKGNKMEFVNDWEDKHIQVIKNEETNGAITSVGEIKYPVGFDLKNVGLGTAVAFNMEIKSKKGRYSIPIIINNNDGVHLEILSKIKKPTFKIIFAYYDIYKNKYKQKLKVKNGIYTYVLEQRRENNIVVYLQKFSSFISMKKESNEWILEVRKM